VTIPTKDTGSGSTIPASTSHRRTGARSTNPKTGRYFVGSSPIQTAQNATAHTSPGGENMNIKQLIVEQTLLDAIKNYCETYTDENVSTACLKSCPFHDRFCKLWECRIIIQRHHEQTLNSKEENEEVKE